MKQSNVYFKIDDEFIAASECCWIRFSPCGCLSGVSTVDSGDSFAATEDDVFTCFASNNVVAARDKEDGYTHKLVTLEAYKKEWAAKLAIRDNACPHVPEWGIPHIPLPEGQEWALAQLDTFYKEFEDFQLHLVPVSNISAPKGVGRVYSSKESYSLCGVETRQLWTQYPHEISDCVTCRKCETIALLAVDPAQEELQFVDRSE